MTAPLYGLLLAGGRSQRMQRDKATLDYAGEPQLMRAWHLLQACTERCFVSVRADQRDEPMRAGLPQLVDTHVDLGPAAGILSAQEAYPDAAWLVVACDLPLLDEDTLRQLVAARAPTRSATAFASRHDGLPEPLCAIWEPASHDLLKARSLDGHACPRKALLKMDTLLLDAPGDVLDNVNTPEERRAMQQRLETSA